MAARRTWPVWLLFGFGLVFELLGAWFAWDAVQFSSRSETAIAEVLEVSRTVRSSGERSQAETFTPTLRYRIPGGELITSKPRVSSGDYDFKVGAEIAVMYDFENPTDVRIGGIWSLWTFPVVFFIAGSLMTGIALLVRKMMR